MCPPEITSTDAVPFLTILFLNTEATFFFLQLIDSKGFVYSHQMRNTAESLFLSLCAAPEIRLPS